MKILVAGGRGQVGSALARLGAEQGLNLVALCRLEMDITHPGSIAHAFEEHQPDLLINAAAYTAVDKAETETDSAYLLNEHATANLADACAARSIPMFHISTDYVFDGTKADPYTEEDEVNPVAAYARSKEAGEQAVRGRLAQHVILRTSWVFSPDGNNFVKTMLRLAAERDALGVVDDQFGGPTSARAIANALLQMAKAYADDGSLPWGTYHFSQAPYVSWHQFASRIIGLAGEMGRLEHEVTVNPVPSSTYPTPVKRPSNSRLDCSKIEAAFPGVVTAWEDDLKPIIQGN
jgi:dTDP-4-dehydrorhamnose reductase